MIGFSFFGGGGVGLAPVVMSSEQEARHRLLSCQPKEIQHAHKETDRWIKKGGMEGWRRKIRTSMCKMLAFKYSCFHFACENTDLP